MYRRLGAAALVTGLLGAVAGGCGGGSSSGGGGAAPATPTSQGPLRLSTSDDGTTRLELQAAAGGANPAPQYVDVRGSGSWTITSDSQWLRTNHGSGSQPVVLAVTAEVAGLAPGTYDGLLTLSEGGQTVDQLAVRLTLTGSGGGGAAPGGTTDAIRPDLMNGTSAPRVSLQDQQAHPYRFPAAAGVSYTVEVDVTPSGSPIEVAIYDVDAGGQAFVDQVVTTPYQTTVTAARDGQIEVLVFDPSQANLELTRLTVSPQARPYSPTTVNIAFHIVGDAPFTGQNGGPLGFYNDLATANDQTAFLADLVQRLNDLYAPTGIQIDQVVYSTVDEATLAGVDPGLAAGGYSRMPATFAEEDGLAGLGIPANDPNYSRFLDVFVVHSPPAGSEITGLCSCRLGMAGVGGRFVGNGAGSAVYVRLFDGASNNFAPRTLPKLASTLSHELGHFFSLFHTTEADLQTDDLPDTPSSTDQNGNGQLDFSELGPDSTNVMFPFAGDKTVWTQDQIDAMQGWLSTREH